MLITFLILCQLSVWTAAVPFNKYPFVFLLDIGNEEVEKANTDQIRLSVPGGSLAVRYPAIGFGDTIGHVRVSGIDFGTDLKANVIEGGPGYKYVVLLFKGNEGMVYDAVVSIQTLPSDYIKNGGKETEGDDGQNDYNELKNNEQHNEEPDEINNNENDIDDANDSSEVTVDTDNDYDESKVPAVSKYSYFKTDTEKVGGKESKKNDIHTPKINNGFIFQRGGTKDYNVNDREISNDIEEPKAETNANNIDDSDSASSEAEEENSPSDSIDEELEPHKYEEDDFNEVPNGESPTHDQNEIDEEVHKYRLPNKPHDNYDYDSDVGNTVDS